MSGTATLVIFKSEVIQLPMAGTSTNYSRVDFMLDRRSSGPLKLLIILSIAVLILLASTQRVYAVGGTVNGSTCASTFGGTWNGVNTCKMTNSSITISSSQTVTIPTGVNLVLSNSAGIAIIINSGGTLAIVGTLTVSNTGSSNGIQNGGSLSNFGALTVSNTGSGFIGIVNTATGTISNSNSGTISVSNSGSDYGIENLGTISNSGTITVSNTDTAYGIFNLATLTNSGTITMSNTGYSGIYNAAGTLTNNSGGTITVSNSDPNSDGIRNYASLPNSGTIIVSNTNGNGITVYGSLSNSGFITVSNSGGTGVNNQGGTLSNSLSLRVSNSGSSTGIFNSVSTAAFSNFGTITVSNTGTYGIYNNGGTLTNNSVGTIMVSNSGSSTGIYNHGALSNSGTITISNAGFIGIYDGVGGTLSNFGAITVSNSGSNSYGIYNDGGTLSNSGTIMVSNTGGEGIHSDAGSISNSGTITLSNSGSSYGVVNFAPLSNSNTITVSNTGGTGIDNFGSLSDSGTITVSNTGGTGVHNDLGSVLTVSNSGGAGITITSGGSLSNYGTIMVSNTGFSYGIINYGTLSSSGTLSVSNSGYTGIYNTGTGTVSSSGTLTVSTTGIVGVANEGILTNNAGGTITISNTSTGTNYGFYSTGTLSNSGTITVSNTGNAYGIGIYIPGPSPGAGILTNNVGGTITVSNTGTTYGIVNGYTTLSNFGTITVSNTGSSIGIQNYGGAFSNSGIVTVSNTGSSSTVGVYILGGAILTNNAGATITVSNTGGTGIYDGSTLTNPGTIIICGGTTLGTIPTSGNPVITCNTTITTHVINDATGQAPSGTEVAGASFHDTAVVTVAVPFAGFIPSGIVIYQFFTTGDCSGPSAGPIVKLNGDGTVPNSWSTGPLAGGTYSYMAFYSGQGRFAGSTSSCEPLTVIGAPPTVSITGLPVSLEATGPSGAVATYTASATSFTGGSLSTTCSPLSGSTFPLGVTTVTCTATDGFGIIGSASSTVTVVDTTPPTLTLPSTITAEAASPAGAVVTYLASATDLVDGSVSVTCNPASGSTFQLHTTVVSCSATDAHGNTVTGSFYVNVVDTTPPTLTVPAARIVEATGPSGAIVTFTVTATDLVDPNPTIVCSSQSGSTYPLGSTMVQCSATDFSGNRASASFSVTIVDTTPPVLSLPAGITAEATAPSGAAVTFSVTSVDIVDPSPSVVCSPTSGSTFALGTTIVSCTATDSSGNSIHGTFTVTVRDTTPPVLTVPASITNEATGPSGAVATFSASATDIASGSLPAICSPGSGSTFSLGTTTVTCTATDAAGNVGSASFTITVKDTTPPVLTLPADITASAFGPSGAVVTYSASATDLVDGPVAVTCLPASGSTFPVFVTTNVVCSASDSHGNKVTGLFHVTVIDTTPPVLTVPPSIQAEATGPSGAIVTFTVTATDNVDPNPIVHCTPQSGSIFPLGSTHVICTATDSSNNSASASFTVTVVDTTPPVVTILGLPTILEATGPNGAVATFSASATDIVNGSLIPTCSPPTGTTFPIGRATVTCTASDAAGNVGSASSTVTVVDTTPPVLTLSADITAEALGASGAVVTYSASATDLVDGSVPVNCIPASGSTFALGTTTVNCAAQDHSGNLATGSFHVVVRDTTSPSVLISGLPVILEATGPTGAVATFSATAVDTVSGSLSPNCSPAPGSIFPLGTTTVTCTATDAAGNLGSASSTVTVRDTTPPALHLPADITALATTGTGSATVTFSATTTDIVDVSDLVTCSPASGSAFPLGTTTVACSSTDAHGNKATGSFHVNVFDYTVSLTPSDQTVLRGGVASYKVTASLASGSTGAPSTVAIALSGVPSDATTSGLTSSLALPGTTTFTIQTGAVSLGDFTLHISASVALGSRSNSAGLHIYDFSLNLNTCPASIIGGQSGTCKLTITAPAGSSSMGLPILTLIVNGCPANTTCSFSPTTVTSPSPSSPAYSTMTIQTTSSTHSGPFTVSTTSSDGRPSLGGSRTSNSVTLTVMYSTAITFTIAEPEYGDTATLTATLKNTVTGALIPNEPLMVTLSTGASVTINTGSNGQASTSFLVSSPSLSFTIQFAGDSAHYFLSSSQASSSTTFTKEDTVVSYTGNTVLTTTSKSFSLQALVTVDAGTEALDSFGGNLLNEKVQFKVYTTTLTPTLLGTFSAPVSFVSGLTTTATLTLTCTSGSGNPPSSINCGGMNLGEGAFDVQVMIDPANAYFTSPISDATFTVYVPTGQFVTGGGWVADSSSTNPKNQANFGFVVRFGKNAQVQGQSVYIYRAPCLAPGPTSDFCDIMLKSNSWIGLGFYTQTVNGVIQQCGNFQSKANVQETDTGTGILYSVQGNNQMTVYACQGNSNSSPAGTYAMQDLSQLGTLFHATPGYRTGLSLGGGSIVVHNNQFTPTISLSPSSCSQGTTVTVSGTGFAPLTAIQVMIGSTVLATTTSDSSGSFTATFTAPSIGSYTVTASDGTNSAWATLTVTS